MEDTKFKKEYDNQIKKLSRLIELKKANKKTADMAINNKMVKDKFDY